MLYKNYPKEINPELLHEELQSIPKMVEPYNLDGEAVKKANYQMILFDGLGVHIQIEKGIDDGFEQIDEIIERHDRTKKSKLEEDREKKEADKQIVLDKLGLTKDELKILLE